MNDNIRIKHELYEKIIDGKAYTFCRTRYLDLEGKLLPCEEKLLTIEDKNSRIAYLQAQQLRREEEKLAFQLVQKKYEKIAEIAGSEWREGAIFLEGWFDSNCLREYADWLDEINQILQEKGLYEAAKP